MKTRSSVSTSNPLAYILDEKYPIEIQYLKPYIELITSLSYGPKNKKMCILEDLGLQYIWSSHPNFPSNLGNWATMH